MPHSSTLNCYQTQIKNCNNVLENSSYLNGLVVINAVSGSKGSTAESSYHLYHSIFILQCSFYARNYCFPRLNETISSQFIYVLRRTSHVKWFRRNHGSAWFNSLVITQVVVDKRLKYGPLISIVDIFISPDSQIGIIEIKFLKLNYLTMDNNL